MTLPERETAISKNAFIQRLLQLQLRDIKIFQQVGISDEISAKVGISPLRNFVFNWCWKYLVLNEVPKLSRNIQDKRKDISDTISHSEQILTSLSTRLLASQFTAEFILICQNVFSGTSRGNPKVTGETLKEELDDQYFTGDWNSNKDEIPFSETKLYGGSQINRLISEFGSTVKMLVLDHGEADDLPTVDDKMFLSKVSDKANNRLHDKLVPILEQLIGRVSFVLKRVPDVASQILQNQRERRVISPSYFKPLETHLKEKFMNFVEKVSKQSEEKCFELFYGQKTILWYMAELSISQAGPEETLMQIFDLEKERICYNVSRIIYNYCVLPFMKNDLWNDLQGQILQIDEKNLNEVLMERSAIEEGLQHMMGQLIEQEKNVETKQKLMSQLLTLLI